MAGELSWEGFFRYVKAGIYGKDWNGGEEGRIERLGWE
jgi:hypothetical protein